MPRWHQIAACVVGLAVSTAAVAEDEAPPERDDVIAIAMDKNIGLKLDKLIGAIEASTFDWTYEDVYTLVDMDHPPEVVKPAAAKAGMFYDSPKSLTKIIEEGRASAPAETVRISKNEDLVVVFETFNDVKYGIDAADAARAALAPRAGHETDDDWFLRNRKAEAVRVGTIAPLEGKIAATTFELILTGSVAAMGECNKAYVNIDLSKIDFKLYRYTLGGQKVDLKTDVIGKNVEKVAFNATGGRRFEVVGTCTKAAAGSPSVATVTMRRAFDSDSWTGVAEFK